MGMPGYNFRPGKNSGGAGQGSKEAPLV